MKNGNFPAMPAHNWVGTTPATGLTKREHLAAMAMQGLLSNPEVSKAGYFKGLGIAENAINFADDLLAALEES